MRDLSTGNEIVDRMGHISFETLSVNVVPASMWNETVIKDGQELKRFTYIGEK